MYTVVISSRFSFKQADLCRCALKNTTCITLRMQQVADFLVNSSDQQCLATCRNDLLGLRISENRIAEDGIPESRHSAWDWPIESESLDSAISVALGRQP
jgi:hypothetical protein